MESNTENDKEIYILKHIYDYYIETSLKRQWNQVIFRLEKRGLVWLQ